MSECCVNEVHILIDLRRQMYVSELELFPTDGAENFWRLRKVDETENRGEINLWKVIAGPVVKISFQSFDDVSMKYPENKSRKPLNPAVHQLLRDRIHRSNQTYIIRSPSGRASSRKPRDPENRFTPTGVYRTLQSRPSPQRNWTYPLTLYGVHFFLQYLNQTSNEANQNVRP